MCLRLLVELAGCTAPGPLQARHYYRRPSPPPHRRFWEKSTADN